MKPSDLYPRLRACLKNRSRGDCERGRVDGEARRGRIFAKSVTEEQRSQPPCPAARPSEMFFRHALRLLPYQSDFAANTSRFKIGLWARQTGKDHTAAAE